MLKTTPSLVIPPFAEKAETPKVKNCKVSGFRDFPDGDQNQRFSYEIKDFAEALLFLERSTAKGQRFRSAYFTNQHGINTRISNEFLSD